MSTAQHQGEAPVSLVEDLPAVDARQAQAARHARSAAERQGAERLLPPTRRPSELRASDLESLVGEDHL
ncbi:MAG: IS5/IS1182 family transposase, partial [Betaproteobacteria bacterium]